MYLKPGDEIPEGFIKGRKPNNSKSTTGYKWYNDGKENKMFKPGEEPTGYSLGKITNTPRKSGSFIKL